MPLEIKISWNGRPIALEDVVSVLGALSEAYGEVKEKPSDDKPKKDGGTPDDH